MEYNEYDTEAGESISHQGQDLGTASYDADGDGTADSVVLVDEERDMVIVATDADGDGDVDGITRYDSDGNVVSRSGDTGSDQTTGHSTGGDDDTGSGDGEDTGTGTGDGDTGTGDGRSGSGGDSDGGDSDGDSDGDSGDDTDGDDDATGSTTGPDDGDDGDQASITVVDDQGRTVEVGPPTVDMNGDGTPDTAVTKNSDGSTVGFTDRNGDGEADQITEIKANGQVTISVSDGKGGWEIAKTGHLDKDGRLVEDDRSSMTSEGFGETLAADQADESDLQDSSQTEAANSDDESSVEAVTSISYTDAEGNSYDLGEPTEDFNGDGTPDTVVTTMEDGTVVGYSDVDGDGLTDQVTQIDPDGTVTIGLPDGQGGWEQAATGTLGPNGEFVPSTD